MHSILYKSRFRGVYKCGKRWKAQLQSNGVQYYLGTYNTEEDAAHAYDKKARDEKGGRSQTNFDENGAETGLCQMYTHTHALDEPPKKKIRFEVTSNHVTTITGTYETVPTHNLKLTWDRLCVLSERIIVASVAEEKLKELQAVSPDDKKASLLSSLSKEIALLSVVKSQLEETIASYFSQNLFYIGDASSNKGFQYNVSGGLLHNSSSSSNSRSSSSEIIIPSLPPIKCVAEFDDLISSAITTSNTTNTTVSNSSHTGDEGS